MYQSVRVFAGGFLLFLFQSSFADETLRGVVVENNMEDLEIGAYLHVVEKDTGKHFFVIYMPKDDDDDTCAAKIKGYWIGRGDTVEVRGATLEQVDGAHVKGHVLTTCTNDSYIRSSRLDTTANK